MISKQKSQQLVAIVLRATTLATRFGLMFYLAANLSVLDMGIFGLYSAGVLLGGGLIPLDVYAHTTRQFLFGGEKSGMILGRHFVFLVLAFFCLLPVAVFLNLNWGVGQYDFLFWIFIAHLFFEVLSTDIGRLLVPLGRPLASNVVLFIRTAFWFFPLIFVFIMGAAAPSLKVVVIAWFFGSFSSVIIGAAWIKFSISGPVKFYLDCSWMKQALASSACFLIATLLFRVLLGADKYIVGGFLGESAVAIYSVYASVSLGVLGLIESGVSSWYYPSLVRSVGKKSYGESVVILKRFFWKNFVASFFLMVSIVVFFPVVAKRFLDGVYLEHLDVFYVISLGVFFYCVSMPFHYYIYSYSEDWKMIVIYAISFLVMIAWSVFYMADFGVLGGAVMLSLSLISVASLRSLFAVGKILSLGKKYE
ncbi:lipopolysaccharide biosynthesis protein [Alloalcanivorax xenomutans]